MGTLAGERSKFYKTMIAIGAPIVLQHLISSSLNLVDTLMIGGLGENAIAAVGIANRMFFFFGISVFGVYSGCGIFQAQYWGKRDTENIHKVMGIMLMFGSIFGIAFTMLSLFFPGLIMDLFTKAPDVRQLGIDYLRIVSYSYLVIAISFMYSFSSRSVHKTTLPMVISAIALGMNTFLNYCLIYGKFGLPAMGVEGAALATLIARVFELLALVILIYRLNDHPLAGRFKDLISFDKMMVKKIVKTGLPVFINESTWALGNTIYFVIFGMLGTSALAVVQICYTVSDIFQALFMGIGSACAVMVGNAIGSNKFERAFDYSKRFIKLTFVLSVFIALALYMTRGVIVNIYTALEPATKEMLLRSLGVIAIYQIPKMYTFMMIVGILRSGGDTKYCMILDLFTVWLIGVPLGYISVVILKLPVEWVLAAVFFEEFIKVFITMPRFYKKKWINNVIEFSYD